MNEISRCCRALNVSHGATLEEVKSEYRDLVQIWHPDRFSENERLRRKAQERLKEINLAWEYLVANAFQDGVLQEPAEDLLKASHAASTGSSPDEQASSQTGEADHSPRSRFGFWLSWFGVVGFLAWGGFFYTRHRPAARPEMTPAPAHVITPTIIPPEPVPKPTEPPLSKENITRAYPFVIDVLASRRFTNTSGWLQAAPLLSPPFAVHVKLTVDDLTEFRLHYGLGQVVFNWDDRAKELLMESPRTSIYQFYPHQGILLPHESHEIIWNVESNRMRVQVDGMVRCQTNGDISGVKGFASLGPFTRAVKLDRFDIEMPQAPVAAQPNAQAFAKIPDDLLSSMVPEESVSRITESDGVAIQTVSDSGDRLMTTEAFQPPFIIRTRAKTDAYNLRLYCGAGMIIFNWELNERELRVHDPLSGHAVSVPGGGLISPNEWHDVVWEIQKLGMKLYVDGRLRFENHKDYRSLDAKVGIGPFRSKVTAAYFKVEKK